jgi:hypothetical protein
MVVWQEEKLRRASLYFQIYNDARAVCQRETRAEMLFAYYSDVGTAVPIFKRQ